VILACNTASTRALRNLQQLHLPKHRPDRRVLGVVRPSVRRWPGCRRRRARPDAPFVGDGRGRGARDREHDRLRFLRDELRKLAPHLELIPAACPLWRPLVEAGGSTDPAPSGFSAALIKVGNSGPTAATDSPWLHPTTVAVASESVIGPGRGWRSLRQGEVVASALKNWLERHPTRKRGSAGSALPAVCNARMMPHRFPPAARSSRSRPLAASGFDWRLAGRVSLSR